MPKEFNSWDDPAALQTAFEFLLQDIDYGILEEPDLAAYQFFLKESGFKAFVSMKAFLKRKMYSSPFTVRRLRVNGFCEIKKTDNDILIFPIMKTELEEQIFLFNWAKYESNMPVLQTMFAIPNGGKRDPNTALRLKASGVKAGIPDILLPVARGGFYGLFIELKRKGGSLSADQKEMIELLTDQGYLVVVCKGADAAIEEIKKYMKLSHENLN